MTDPNSVNAIVEETLRHYGVKGMRWGRRKDDTPSEVSTSQKPGGRVRAKGGANQEAHPDAVRVAASRQKAKKSSTDALSTKELQELTNRMNLEQQVSRLNAQNSNVKKGQAAVAAVLAVGTTANAVIAFSKSPAGQALLKGLKS